eukprot:6612898-Ditylum_brightwellii.AAC.1
MLDSTHSLMWLSHPAECWTPPFAKGLFPCLWRSFPPTVGTGSICISTIFHHKDNVWQPPSCLLPVLVLTGLASPSWLAITIAAVLLIAIAAAANYLLLSPTFAIFCMSS